MKLIDKDALVEEIGKRRKDWWYGSSIEAKYKREECDDILSFLDTLEVKDPYEQCIQYASIECGIKAHAEDYSFNIESELFNQLTKQQQALWRKEIEQACISGGYSGLNLAKDPRYKENLEVKGVDLEKEPHYPKAKEASGTLKKMLNNITEESLEKARKQLEKEYVSKDLEEVVKDLWQEINTGHQYSILDSYNQFYGMCLDVCDWQKKQTISKAISWLQSNIDCGMWSKEFRKVLED